MCTAQNVKEVISECGMRVLDAVKKSQIIQQHGFTPEIFLLGYTLLPISY